MAKTNKKIHKPLTEGEDSQGELERRVFHLKTLYDVSREIGSLRDIQEIMKHLLMMVMGTFGAVNGVLLLVDMQRGRMEAGTQRGLDTTAIDLLSQAIESGSFREIEGVTDIQMLGERERVRQRGTPRILDLLSSFQVHVWIPFGVNETLRGGIGLGDKLAGDPYTPADQELLSTLAKQGAVAIENAKLYQEVRQHAEGLEAKVKARTRELEEANRRLEEASHSLEEWNRTLEDKVRQQVKEIERMGRIKRYLSPQIAETVLKDEGDDLFKTHRREVTVVFLDLRGFTNFSDSAEPEEVIEFLRGYHAEMGKLIFQFEGTLEHFSGDGIMVFFNDPIPRKDHTEVAVRMTVEMQARAKELRPGWLKKGYDLDLGVGIAAGYATLGTIGFEGRMDYGAVGNVTNLAARLSSEAKGGQILTNQRTLSKIEDLVEAEPLEELHLKGFHRPVAVFNIVKLKERAGSSRA
ncbi:MAG: adenylate/guanylate cyclase domain-containing protein [candidate division NC10 bacterium]